MPDSVFDPTYNGETLQPFLLKAGPLHTTSNRPNALNQPFLPHTIAASVSNVTTAFYPRADHTRHFLWSLPIVLESWHGRESNPRRMAD